MSVADLCDIILLDGVSREEWLAHRTTGIGGSDAGVIIGCSKYASPYSLWCEKSGLPTPEDEGNEATRWGNRLERVIAEAYAEETGAVVLAWNVMLRSKERPWATANVDFWIVDPNSGVTPQMRPGIVYDWTPTDPLLPPPGILAILECKTSGIATHGAVHHWNDEAIPPTYYAQGMHYGIVTGVHSVKYAALLAGQGLVVRDLPWDNDLADDIVADEDEFWRRVQECDPPPADASEATEEAQKARWPRSISGKAVEVGPEGADMWDLYELLKVSEKEAIDARKALRLKLIDLIGDAEVATMDGVPFVSYKSNKDTDRFAAKVFASDHPELYKEYVRPVAGNRVLRAIK